jgi:hypothetical protein
MWGVLQQCVVDGILDTTQPKPNVATLLHVIEFSEQVYIVLNVL